MAAPVRMEGGEPDAKQKARVRIFLAVFLGLQALVPLRYYLGDDLYDERFSWRMFSAVRVQSCETYATERVSDGERPIDLNRAIHRAWVTTLSRNRADTIRAFLRRRCDEEGVTSVKVVNRCVEPDGERVPDLVYERDCESGEVTEP
jgi:hypothetical protein